VAEPVHGSCRDGSGMSRWTNRRARGPVTCERYCRV
jgi:hypothetical protein